MNAVSSGSQGIVVFFLLKYAIRALLSTSNIDSFARKLLDSENSRMTKHMHGFLIVRHFVSMLIGCCFYGVDFFLFSWQLILSVLWMSFVLKILITSLSYGREQKQM